MGRLRDPRDGLQRLGKLASGNDIIGFKLGGAGHSITDNASRDNQSAAWEIFDIGGRILGRNLSARTCVFGLDISSGTDDTWRDNVAEANGGDGSGVVTRQHKAPSRSAGDAAFEFQRTA